MVSILRSHPISSKPWSSRFSSRARPKGLREQGMDVQPSPCGGHVHSFPAGQARPGLLASTHEDGAWRGLQDRSVTGQQRSNNMRKSISPWWPPRQRMSRHTQEPGSVLFQGLRMCLTLWYCGMLGMALVLFGVVLYFGTQYFLLTPIETDAALHAHTHAELWLTGSLDRACPFLVSSDQSSSSPGQGLSMPERIVSFAHHGPRLPGQHTTGLPPPFLSPTFAKRALETGQPSTDTVDAGGSVGQIYRYALPVPSPTGKGYVGVVGIGESIQVQDQALSLLQLLLVLVCGAKWIRGP